MTRPIMERRARARSARQRPLGFTGHALAEYVLGAALVAAGLHMSGGPAAVVVTVGGLLVVLNLLTASRVGAVAVIGPRGHHLADLLLVAALAASPFAALGQLHVAGVVVAEIVAAVLLRIERWTRYGPALATPAPAPAGEASRPAAGRPALPMAVRRGAWTLGVVVGAARRAARERAGPANP